MKHLVNCDHCNAQLVRYAYQVETNKRNFCDNNCKNGKTKEPPKPGTIKIENYHRVLSTDTFENIKELRRKLFSLNNTGLILTVSFNE